MAISPPSAFAKATIVIANAFASISADFLSNTCFSSLETISSNVMHSPSFHSSSIVSMHLLTRALIKAIFMRDELYSNVFHPEKHNLH